MDTMKFLYMAVESVEDGEEATVVYTKGCLELTSLDPIHAKMIEALKEASSTHGTTGSGVTFYMLC